MDSWGEGPVSHAANDVTNVVGGILGLEPTGGQVAGEATQELIRDTLLGGSYTAQWNAIETFFSEGGGGEAIMEFLGPYGIAGIIGAGVASKIRSKMNENVKMLKHYKDGPEKFTINRLKEIRRHMNQIQEEIHKQQPFFINNYTLLDNNKETLEEHSQFNNEIMNYIDTKKHQENTGRIENILHSRIPSNSPFTIEDYMETHKISSYNQGINTGLLTSKDEFFYYKQYVYTKETNEYGEDVDVEKYIEAELDGLYEESVKRYNEIIESNIGPVKDNKRND